MSEDNLIQIRREKAQKWVELGFEPYASYSLNDEKRKNDSVGGMITYHQHDVDTDRVFTTVGRVMSMRGQGGVRFLDLVDEGEKIQLFVSKKDVSEQKFWDIFQYIDIGDIIEVAGTLTRTKSGELSIKIKTVRPLTKCLIAPTKSGAATVEDSELKYRQRYRDLIENNDSRNVFVARSQIIKAIREFMDRFLFSMEVETPVLTTLRSGANARPFETHHNALDKDLYLRIAPELYLKRLIVGGFNNVYEIGRLFRNEGISTRHNPEFTAIEYYQAYADYGTLIKQTKEMLKFIAEYPETGYDAETSPFNLDCIEVGMTEAVCRSLYQYHNVDIHSWNIFNGGNLEWTDIRGMITDILNERGLTELGDTFSRAIKGVRTAGSFLFALYEVFAEPHLSELFRNQNGSKSRPVFIVDYPVEVSPLAKKHSKEHQYLNGIELTERFELFIEGKEIANAFSELNDPDDQADRFRQQLANRENGDQEAMDFDEDYIRALMMGMPPTAGFGMGIDRLVMLFTNQSCIRDVILFPLMR